MNGKVKFYNEGKGYGFIVGDDGVDYFFHNSSQTKNEILEKDDRVAFDPEKGERGWVAKEVCSV